MSIQTEIRGAIILSPHNGWQPQRGSVGIEDGLIAAVQDAPLGAPSERVVDGAGRILMPGLVNGHCHGDMTLARGLGDGLTLAEQNERFADTSWFYSLITDEARALSRQLTYCEALLGGTTFIMENMYWGLGQASARAMAATGIEGALAEDVRPDFSDADVFVAPEALRRFKADCESHGLVPVLGGMSEEDFEPGRLHRADALAGDCDMLTTAHLAENDWRLEIVRDRFGMGPVEYLDSLGLLSPRLIASHMVYPTGGEIGLLAQHGVKVVNTPLCEMKIADGVAPIPAMLDAGVTVGLGTDGAMWNNSNDIFREMKGMLLLHTITGGIRSLQVRQVLNMATCAGAGVFGLEDSMGSIEPGMRANCILVDATAPHMTPLRTGAHENVASNVVFCATGADVTDVFVRGRRLVKNRQMTAFDLPALCTRVNELSAELALGL